MEGIGARVGRAILGALLVATACIANGCSACDGHVQATLGPWPWADVQTQGSDTPGDCGGIGNGLHLREGWPLALGVDLLAGLLFFGVAERLRSGGVLLAGLVPTWSLFALTLVAPFPFFALQLPLPPANFVFWWGLFGLIAWFVVRRRQRRAARDSA